MTKIMIDPGHGGADPGAVAAGFGLREKDLTLVISRRIKYKLDTEYEAETRLTRDGDTTLNLSSRTNMANNWGANCFASVHINAGGGTGYEDYVHVSVNGGTATARYRDTIHAEVSKVLSKYGLRNRGRKSANFHVLRATRMSSILTEAAFIDNANDQRLLQREDFLRDMADAHAIGIANALNLRKKASPTPATPPSTAPGGQVGLHRVIADGNNVGAWGNQSYLLRAVEKAVEGGAREVIVQATNEGGDTKVKVNLRGKVVELDGFLVKGTNYVPIRQVLEALGHEVSWDSKNNTVMVK